MELPKNAKYARNVNEMLNCSFENRIAFVSQVKPGRDHSRLANGHTADSASRRLAFSIVVGSHRGITSLGQFAAADALGYCGTPVNAFTPA